MVILAIDISPHQFDRVSNAVAEYGYSSIQQFVIAASWNQIALHEADQRELQPGAAWSLLGKELEETATGSPSAVISDDRDWRRFVGRVEASALPGVLAVEPYVGPEALLWGQTNRVLPVAAGVRVLANMLANSDEGSVTLDDWHQQATKVAQALRVELASLDKAAGRGRSEQWATAFPSIDPASANRFMGQFLGWPRRDGRIAEGGAIWLGFVAFEDAQNSRVSLTDAGVGWAGFANPIFDGEAPTAAFSEKETRFFLEHLREKRPTEFGLLFDVAKLVEGGKSRVEIDAELVGLYPTWAKHSGTMRAGALGRLSDLGLLTRERHGLSVSYHLTPLAASIGLVKNPDGAR